MLQRRRAVAQRCSFSAESPVKSRLGDGSDAPSLGRHDLDVRLVPLASTATHEPTGILRALWARWKPLLQTQYATILIKMKR